MRHRGFAAKAIVADRRRKAARLDTREAPGRVVALREKRVAVFHYGGDLTRHVPSNREIPRNQAEWVPALRGSYAEARQSKGRRGLVCKAQRGNAVHG